MSPEYHTIFRYRLKISLFSIGEVCLICRKVYPNIFIEYKIHCKDFRMHEFIRMSFLSLNLGNIAISVYDPE